MRTRAGIALILALLVTMGSAAADPVVTGETLGVDWVDQVHRDLGALQNRITGSADAQQATAYVERTFRQLGLQRVSVTHFPAAVPVDKGTTLTLSTGEIIRVRPLWPNLVHTCLTPPEGLSGPLVYGGLGSFREFDGKLLEGSLVLLDFNCAMAWLNAAYLGAKAVVLIAPDDTLRGEAEQKFISIPVNIPRLWVPREQGLELKRRLEAGEQLQATLHSQVEWEQVQGDSVRGWLSGTDPTLRNETIAIQTYYDSNSVVLGLAPGAESLNSLAGLLALIERLKAHPPKRSVLFVAGTGHHQALAGSKHLLGWLRDQKAAMKDKKSYQVNPVAVFSLDLSSGSGAAGVFWMGYFYGYKEDIAWKFAEIGKFCREQYQSLARRLGLPVGDLYQEAFVDAVTAVKGKEWRTYLPGRLAFDSEVAVVAGIPGVTFATVNDTRRYVDTPLDTLDRVNLPNVKRQLKPLLEIIPRLLSVDNSDHRFFAKDLDDNFAKLTARVVEFNIKTGAAYFPNKPVPGSIAIVRALSKTNVGVRGELAAIPDKKGNAVFTGMCNSRIFDYKWRVEAYRVNSQTGEIDFAPDLGRQGNESYPIELKVDTNDKGLTVVLFNCEALTLFDTVDQTQFLLLRDLQIFDVTTEAAPYSFGFCVPVMPQQWAPVYEPAAVTFAPPGTLIKITLGASVLGRNFLLLNATPKEPLGIGFNVSEQHKVTWTSLQVGEDMWILNQDRIVNKLNRFGITNARLEQLHRETRKLLNQARRAREQMRYSDAVHYGRAAWGFELKAYPDVMKTANDIIKGVIFYLFLLLPFSFFAERLLIASPEIKRQIVWTAVVFIIMFAILAWVHPAFRMTSTPYIILVAFAIVALSVVVTYIVVSKFEEQMERVRLGVSGAKRIQRADVGRIQASSAAFLLGIANMRRRVMRTTLTCVTLVLLTFTVLSFTSVVSSVRINRVKLKGTPSYTGLMLRSVIWEPIERGAWDAFANDFGQLYPVCIRAWFLSALVGNQSYVDCVRGDRVYTFTALLGIGDRENEITRINRALKYGGPLRPDQNDILLPETAAETLGIRPQDVGQAQVSCVGIDFTVIGIIDETAMKKIVDLDGESILPVDYLQMEEIRRRTPMTRVGREQLQKYRHIEPSEVGIVAAPVVLSAAGTLRSLAIGVDDPKRVEEIAKDLAQRLGLNLYVGEKKNVYLYSSVGLTSFRGVTNVFIPVLIAALIVLNTMLGSVYERTREIGIFSALGLAPHHVGALFIAEACVYAVLGGIAGYLFGQVLSKIIAAGQMIPGLDLNYSSLSAVGTEIVVISVVLLSTLYPAKKASELCVPGVERSWRLPEADGDHLQMPMPFTVHHLESLGLLTYLLDFLQAHSDYSLGQFSTAESGLGRHKEQEKEGYALHSTVWLAPYDLGVSVDFGIIAHPTEDAAVFAMDVYSDRKSGDVPSWLRATRNFLNIIRKQFLIWRTFDDETRNQFRQRGEEMLGSEA